MNLKNHLLTKQSDLTMEINALEKFIKKLPSGKLAIRQRDGNYYYSKKIYSDLPEQICKGKSNRRSYKEVYLPKDSKEAITLAQGEYATWRLKDAKQELNVVNQYLKIIEKEPEAKHFLETHPGIKDLVEPSLKNPNEELEKWRVQDYYKNPYRPEGLKVPTVIPDLKVRSKSEADIISRLVHFGVPFHYEEGFCVGGMWRFPDITCKALSSPYKKFHWEHLGGLSSFKYFDENMKKLKEFYSCGLIPWKNLIITTETDDEPLDINWVDEIINYYLL